MAEAVYLLCAVTSVVCAVLLMRAYAHSKTRLLFWGSVSFVGHGLSNILLVIDLVLIPTVDLEPVRALAALTSMLPLLWGLIWNLE